MPIFEVHRDMTRKVNNKFPVITAARVTSGKYEFNASGILIPMHIEADDAVRIFLKKIITGNDPKLGFIMCTSEGIRLDQFLKSMAEIRLTPAWNEVIAKIITANATRQFSLEKLYPDFKSNI